MVDFVKVIQLKLHKCFHHFYLSNLTGNIPNYDIPNHMIVWTLWSSQLMGKWKITYRKMPKSYHIAFVF